MGTWWRRIRAALGNAVTWALGWTVVGAGLGLYFGSGIPDFPLLSYMMAMAVTTGIAGFVAGGSFAVVLGVMERKRTLADLRVSRIALWGAVGGMAFPAFNFVSGLIGGGILPATIVLTTLGVTGVLGAACSAGSLLLARRAERLELEAGDLDELEAGSL